MILLCADAGSANDDTEHRMDPEQSVEPSERRRRSIAPAIALALIVGVLVALWGTAAGALMATGSGDRDVATEQLTADAELMDRGAGMLERAATVAQLRDAGVTLGALQVGLIERQRRVGELDDPEIVDAALRAHRDVVRVVDGWSQLATLDDDNLGAWPRTTAGKILKATNRLRDRNAAAARKLAPSGETPADLDHERARAATLKVARFLARPRETRGA